MSIDSLTGNLVARRTLLTAPGRGVPVGVALTYNSDRRLVSSRFGSGWNLSYNIRYVEDAAGNVAIVWGDGRVDIFSKFGASFVAPAGVHLVLDAPAPGELRLTSLGGLELRFADSGHRKLTEIRDPNGNALKLDHDAGGRLIQIRDDFDRSFHLSYESDGMLSSVADTAAARAYTFEYDAAGRLTTIVDPHGYGELFSYSSDGLLTGTQDRRGTPATVTYWQAQPGSATRLPKSIVKSGNEMQFDFYDTTATTIVTDPNGADWAVAYDGEGRVASITSPNPVSATTTFAWDAAANLTALTDPNGNTETFAYDAMGRLMTATTPLEPGAAAVSHVAWDAACSRPSSVTDPRGSTWSFTYDSGCNLVRVDDPAALGAFETRSVDTAGQTTSRTDRTGRTTTFAWDGSGSPESMTDPAGGKTSFSFDVAGRLVEVADALGKTFSYSWDTLDRLISTTDGLGTSDALKYDANGNLVEYTDREGSTTQYAYDQLDRLTSVVDALGRGDARTFDANGNLVAYTDRRGNTWSQSFDAANRLLSRTNPLGGTWLYAYDPAGNLTSHTDARGQLTTLTYDQRGRLVRRDYADGTRTSLTWDANGSLLSATDSVVGPGTVLSSLAYTYDGANRRASFTDAVLGRSVVYGRDGDGRVTSRTDGAGSTITYTYDAAGRPATMSAYGGGATFGYDAAGHLVLDQRSSGAHQAYTYDGNNRIDSVVITGPPAVPFAAGLARGSTVGEPVLASFDYTRDANGRIVAVVRETAEMVAFTLDGLGRIVEEQGTLGGAYTLSMTYDASGNRLSHTLTTAGGTIAASAVFDAADGLTSYTVQDGPTLDVTTIIRDGNGARATAILPIGATRSYARDARNRVTAIGQGGMTTFLDYDPFDRVTRRTSGTTVNDFFFPAAPLVLENGFPKVTIASLPGDCADGTPLADRPLVGTEGSGRFDLFPAGNTSFPVGGFTPAVAALPNGAVAFGNDNYADGDDRKPENSGDGIWMPTNYAFGLQLPTDWVWVPINRAPSGGDPGNQQPVDPETLDPLTRGAAGAAVDPAFESLQRRLTLWPGSMHWMLLPEEAVTGAPVLCGSDEPTVPVPPGLFSDLMPTQPVPPGMFDDLIPLLPVPPGMFNDLMPRPVPFFRLDVTFEPLLPIPPVVAEPKSGPYWLFDPPNSGLIIRVLNPGPENGKFWVFLGGLTDVDFELVVTDEKRSANGNVITAPYVPNAGSGR